MSNEGHFNNTELRILEAAEQEFLAKGFSGARTTSIAEAAGVTHAMLHYYFRTKEKLFDRIISEKVKLVGGLIVESISNDNMSLFEKIRNVIERHLEFVAANPALPRFIVVEVFGDPERSKIMIDKILTYAPSLIAGLQRSLDDAAARGECRKADARMLIIDIVSLNLFSFMAMPLVNAAMGNIMADTESFVNQRKIENYDTIIRKLKP